MKQIALLTMTIYLFVLHMYFYEPEKIRLTILQKTPLVCKDFDYKRMDIDSGFNLYPLSILTTFIE